MTQATQDTQVRTYTASIGGRDLVIETGRLAQQAGGAVTVRMGDTMLLCAATMSTRIREGIDFFPLSVEYEERLYAAGRIPGSFMRREGRPSDRSILSARVIDRTLRPLFPDDMLNEVQIILTSLAHDQETPVDMLGIVAASAAIMISNIPWNGPVAGVRVGLINGELVVNPTTTQMETSKLDLRVSGTADAINMVECGAEEVDEETMLQALKLAHDSIQPIIQLMNQMRADLGKEKSDYAKLTMKEGLQDEVRARVEARTKQIVSEMTVRNDRREALDEMETEVVQEYDAKNAAAASDDEKVSIKQVKEAMHNVLKEVVRRRIVDEGLRPDGRDTVTIRPLSAGVGIIPRVHGSGLFQRGQTQVLTVATLGTPRDSQMLDGLDDPEAAKRYIHHYNFPPYSTGETGMMRGPKRREIGHGALAENALVRMIPDEKAFPYTIRLVSEVLSSNGSTSMASVCGSTLALMDAGVPIKQPVAGIAMGLIAEGGKMAVLTDIQGLEDHLGDMDFKVAGTRNGITALQMDIKISGVTDDVMRQALKQALDARLQILDLIVSVLPKPRPELKESAPRMVTVKIDSEKIGALIGPGGKNVRGIQDSTGVKIDIQEDGTVFIAGADAASVYAAQERVRGLTEEAALGHIYTGKITRTENYGAFVEFMAGKEGLVHVSQLADYKVMNVADEFNVGDEIMVMVTDIDPTGRVRLSRQAVLEGWTLEEAREKDRGGRSGGGGGDRGRPGGDRGGRPGGGGGGYRGGGDRSGGGGGGDRGPRNGD
jgi:polyribonucleotide nucleotidyltransferase